ncbi:metallophosphoesterase [bacterium]|nr:MAG: metallophosphoesterase [bacterium]
MRIAVLADVHGNLPALEAVVKDFQGKDAHQVWHLGDAVGYGAEPFACLQLMADLETLMIMGNHELATLQPAKAAGFNHLAVEAINWTRDGLSPDSLAYLRSLPSHSSPFPEVFLFHGLPGNITGYIRTAETAEMVLSILEQRDHRIRYAFFGHTHRAMVFTQLEGRPIRMFEPDDDLILAPGRRYLLNPGSVGQPRNGDPRAQYLIYDQEEGLISFRRVEYDIQQAQSRIIEADLPPSLAARLSQGM